MWSCASTATPVTEPSSQWFGSGLGQSGSTSKAGGACAPGKPANRVRVAVTASNRARLFICGRFRGRSILRAVVVVLSEGLRPSGSPRRSVAALARATAIAAQLLLLPAVTAAHDIPISVVVQAFLRPQGQVARVLIRVPMAAMRDVEFPLRGDGL